MPAMAPFPRLPAGPTLLTALPLAVAGVLALHALRADYALLRARQGDAALGVLRSVGEVARGAVRGAAEDAAGRAAAVLDRTEALRGLVLGGTVELVTVHRDGRRVFPPEEPATPLVSEREKLSAVSGPLAAALAGLETAPQSWGWVAERDGGALLHCRREGRHDGRREGRREAPATDLCVMLGAARLRAVLTDALGTAYPDGGGWRLSLVDPFDARVWSRGEISSGEMPWGGAGTDAVSLPLDGPLRGWQAGAQPEAGTAIGDPPALTLAVVVLPLLGSWLLLVRQVQRSQRAKLADSRHRAEIAAQLSHELRTPLANLRLYAGLIHRRAGEAEAVRDYCTVIEQEAERLSRLADDAVAFARGEAPEGPGRGEAVPDAAVPDAVVREVAERLRPLCAAAGCPVTVHAAAPAARRFDRAAVEQILTNLIDNARKHAPGTPVEVASWTERRGGKERLFLAVRDHGPGVPAALRDRIFEPMVRGGGGAPGFGLGLAAVRRLARVNGGDARVEDGAPGARFVAWIGLAPPAGAGDRGEAEGTACAS